MPQQKTSLRKENIWRYQLFICEISTCHSRYICISYCLESQQTSVPSEKAHDCFSRFRNEFMMPDHVFLVEPIVQKTFSLFLPSLRWLISLFGGGNHVIRRHELRPMSSHSPVLLWMYGLLGAHGMTRGVNPDLWSKILMIWEFFCTWRGEQTSWCFEFRLSDVLWLVQNLCRCLLLGRSNTGSSLPHLRSRDMGPWEPDWWKTAYLVLPQCVMIEYWKKKNILVLVCAKTRILLWGLFRVSHNVLQSVFSLNAFYVFELNTHTHTHTRRRKFELCRV